MLVLGYRLVILCQLPIVVRLLCRRSRPAPGQFFLRLGRNPRPSRSRIRRWLGRRHACAGATGLPRLTAASDRRPRRHCRWLSLTSPLIPPWGGTVRDGDRGQPVRRPACSSSFEHVVDGIGVDHCGGGRRGQAVDNWQLWTTDQAVANVPATRRRLPRPDRPVPAGTAGVLGTRRHSRNPRHPPTRPEPRHPSR